MSKLKFLPTEPPQPPHDDITPDESRALAEVRQREHTNIKDIIWVAVVLAIVMVIGSLYQTGHGADHREADRAAQINAAVARALPPPGYETGTRYPRASEIEANAKVEEARALAEANAAENAADPVLNPKAAGAPPAPSFALPSPKPFSDPNYTGGLPPADAAAVAVKPGRHAKAGPPA
jgi:hypothetical protein